ncbi:MAG: GEVED domain-containing protein, partial [Flavobacteriales bacterium]
MTNLTFTGADLSWTASSSNPAGGYQWEVRDDASNVVDNGSTAGTTASTSGLTADTDYGLFVRAICGAGDTSTWAGPHPFYTGYCVAAGNNTAYYIEDFTTTGGSTNISNSGSGYSGTGYGDFTGQTVSKFAGGTVDFNANFSGTSTYHFRVWVDWNKDLDFDDAGELMFNGTVYQNTYAGSLTVPSGTPEGNYRMRIHNTFTGDPFPCGTSNGETEDYTFTVVAPPPCAPPLDVAVTGVSTTTADFSWTASVSNPSNGYQWEVRDGASTVVDNGTTSGTTASASGLTANTDYGFYVRSDCGTGQSTWAGPVNFYTGYCVPEGTGATHYFSDFSTTGGSTNISNLNSGFSPDGYGDFTSMSVSTSEGYAIDFTATWPSSTYTLAIWVDWNNDLDFDDAGELVFSSGTSYLPTPASGSITVPAGTPVGSYRMRIRNGYLGGAPTTCGTTAYGEAEDYTFIVTPPPACPKPFNAAISAITGTSASFSWTDNGAASYDYEVRTSGAAGDGPAGLALSGNVAGSPVVLALTPNTAYTAYVRSYCAGPDSSTWTSGVVFSTPCVTFTAPYLETFDADITTPDCWDNEPGAGTVTWKFANGTGNPSSDPDYGAENVTDHTSGSGFFAWFDGGSTTSIPWLTSPVIDFSTLTTPIVRLYVFSNNINDAAQNTLKVQAYNGTAWVEIGSYAGNNPDWVKLDVLVPGSIPSPTRFRLTIETSTTGGSAFNNDILVDDFSVIEAPTCLAPTGVTLSNITSSSAELSWTDNSSQSYNYEVRSSGAPGSGPSGLALSGNAASGTPPVTLSPLVSGTPYTVYVQGSCSGGSDLSMWTSGVDMIPGTVQIGSGGTTNTNFPIYSCTAYNYTQQIYPAASVTGSSYITKIRFKYVSSGTTIANWNNWTVYMGNTSQTNFATTTSWIPLSGMTQVFSGTVNPVAGEWMEITLDIGFQWDGVSNIVVAVDENSAGTSCTAAWASFTSGTNTGIYYRNATTNPDPASPPTASGRSGTLAQIQLQSG